MGGLFMHSFIHFTLISASLVVGVETSLSSITLLHVVDQGEGNETASVWCCWCLWDYLWTYVGLKVFFGSLGFLFLHKFFPLCIISKNSHLKVCHVIHDFCLWYYVVHIYRCLHWESAGNNTVLEEYLMWSI